MSFNHRLIRHSEDNSIGIYEVYYDKSGNIRSVSEKPIIVGNDIEDLRCEYDNLKLAFDDSILKMEDIEFFVK